MLKGKSAIVTGSTSGIGSAIARALAGEGVNVMLNGFGDAQEIEALRAELSETYGVEVLYSPADMRRADEIEAMVSDAQATFGSVDILVNNAGIQHVDAVEDFPLEKWDDIIAINMSSAFHTIRAALPAMKAKGWGRIVNIASIHGLTASPFKSAYVTAKHGVVGLTRTVALEAAEHGVTVNAICPGYVRTPLVERQIPDTAKVRGISEEEVIRDVMLDRQATKKFVEVDEVAAFAVFLCTDGAASITGVALPQDGGWSAL
ncbi:3-hydroxybutyrate dehydrogenase [Pseudomonadota bacterium]